MYARTEKACDTLEHGPVHVPVVRAMSLSCPVKFK